MAKDILEPKTNTDSDVVSLIVTDFNRAWKAKQSKEALFREIYRRYRSYLEVSQQTTRSSLFIPESFTLVETVAPRLTAKKPTFKAIPRNSSAISKADVVGELLDYRYDTMNLQQKIKTFVKQGLIYGTSIFKMGWDVDKNQPYGDPVDIADIWPDPDTYNWKDGFIVHRFYKTLFDLENSGVKYKNLSVLKIKKQNKTSIRDDQMRLDRYSVQGVPMEPNRDGFEILEWWGFVDGMVKVRAVADRTVLIRDEDTPYPLNELPFVPFFDQEVPFEKWGIGEIEPILDLQDEENVIRNQRIDEKNLSIHNMWLVSKTAGIDYKTLVSKPGGIILANDINGVKPLEKQNISIDSVTEVNMIKTDIKNATGVNDYVKGADSGDVTATEAAIKSQESNQRFNEKANNLELSLKQIGHWVVALDAEFLTDDLKIQIMGKYGIEEKVLSPEDIKDEFDIDIESGSSLPSNPDMRRQQLRELLQVIHPILTNPAGIPDGLREFLRTLIQAYDLKNTDEILQGTQHPMVSQAMANLSPEELQGVNPQMVEELVRQQLTASGQFNPSTPQGMNTQEFQGAQGGMGAGQPPMRQQIANPNTL